MEPALTLYHAPNTRSSSIRILLEELGAPYVLHPLNMKQGEHRQPAFLAVNPLGKVPALTDGAALITEQVAIALYLADRFPQAALAPALDDPARGPYLRWMALYSGAFEPAVIDFGLKRDNSNTTMSPYGAYDAVIDLVEAQLTPGPYLLGNRFTAADVVWGAALGWTMQSKMVPQRPAFVQYVERLRARPAVIRAHEADTALAASQEPPAAPATST